ncbi:MAG: hypothetical protein AAGK21_05855 [Bacteroidota bacterium]
MPQTLIALIAIVVFSILALQQHETSTETEEFAITAEVEQAATRLARQRLATIVSATFDEADVGVTRTRTGTANLTLSADFGPDDPVMEEVGEASYDDVDDYHLSVTSDVRAPWMGKEIVFSDSVHVEYVDLGTLASSASPTLAKSVTVFVSAAPEGFIGQPEIAVTLRQIVTPTLN